MLISLPLARADADLRRGFHLGHAAGTAHAAHVGLGLGLVQYRDAGRVVAPVFQPLQSFDEYRYHVAMGDRSHNAAHRFRSLLVSLAF